MSVSSSPVLAPVGNPHLVAATARHRGQNRNSPVKQHQLLPSFLIIGAAKSGTTSLHEYLRSHPSVFLPKYKEMRFFCPEEHGAISETVYRKLFAGAKAHQVIGETAGGYLRAPEAPERISAFLGRDTKIIAILRNPVDKALSFWRHNTREGWEQRSFAAAIRSEELAQPDPDFSRKTGLRIANVSYLASARYSAHLERYFRVFPAGNIRIYFYEEFFQPGLPQWRDLCAFLEIDPGFVPEEKIYNRASTARSLALQRWYSRPSWLKTIMKPLIPLEYRNQLRRALGVLNRKHGGLQPLDDNSRRHLEEIFRPDVRRLEDMLGKNLRDLWFD